MHHRLASPAVSRTRGLSIVLVALGAISTLAAGCDFRDAGGGHGHPHGPGGSHAADDAHAEDGAHAHGPAGRSVAVTVWSERFEVFLEHELIVVGRPVRFVTHVTDLQTLQPRRAGPVTFVLDAGSTPLEHVEPAPARAGIYTPELTFTRAGPWNVRLRVPLADGGKSDVELGAFTVYASADEADAAALPAEPDGVAFLKEQQWKIPTAVATVARRPMVERIVVSGRVEVRAAGRAVVSSPVAGHLARPADDAALPSIGERVEAGQVIAQVVPPLAGADLLAFESNRQQIAAARLQLALARTELLARKAEADADVARARAAHEAASRREAITRGLVERKARAARELVEAELAKEAARVDLEAALATAASYARSAERLPEVPDGESFDGGLPSVSLRAPIAGVVVARGASVGELVRPETAVIEIVDASEVQIVARVPETDLARIGEAPSVLAAVPGEARLRPITGEGGGRLVAPGLAVDPATRTAGFVYEVPNADGALRPGLSLPVHVETTHAKSALAIPASALVEEDARPVVFVMLAGETFEKRDVVLGVRDGGWVEVTSGLEAGERVVTSGAYAIRLASVSTAIPAHGHAH